MRFPQISSNGQYHDVFLYNLHLEIAFHFNAHPPNDWKGKETENQRKLVTETHIHRGTEKQRALETDCKRLGQRRREMSDRVDVRE